MKLVNIIIIFSTFIFNVTSYACLDKLACKLILPSTTFEPPPLLSEADIKTAFRLEEAWSIKPVMLKTSEHKHLDTVTLTPPNFRSNKKQKVIVVFNPNAALWQDMLPDMINWARDLDAKVVGFNYRGVGHSESKPKKSLDLIRDGIELVEHIKRISDTPMVIYGRSIGGSVASYVANHMYKRGWAPKLFVDRSFRKLSSAANHIINKFQKQAWKSDTWEGSLFALAPVPSLARLGIFISKWSLNTEKEFKAIPKSQRLAIYVSNDEMFPFNQSLCSSLPEDEQKWLFKGSHNQPLDSLMHHKINGLNATNLFYNFVLDQE